MTGKDRVRKSPPLPGKEEGERIEYWGLEQVQAKLQALQAQGQLDSRRVRQIRARSVVPGEQLQVGEGVLQGIASAQAVTAGAQVTALGEGRFKVEEYGYLSLTEGRLSVISPLYLDPDRMAAYWLILDEKARPVTAAMLFRCLAARKVVEGILDQEIERLTSQVAAGTHTCGASLVAYGRPPKHGQDGVVQLLVTAPQGQKAEKLEGVRVQEGEILARRRLATPGEPGIDVCGRILEARDGREQSLRTGENVQVERKGSLEIFRAKISGLARVEGDQLSVTRLLAIKGAVGFDTGNLNFDGHIHIEGSVNRGFSVRASRDLAIDGGIEASAQVQAQGNIWVGKGIVGGKTRVVAGGSVQAHFVEEATVMASRDIALSGYAHRAILIAGGQVRLGGGRSGDNGSFVGGEAWGRKGLSVYTAGSAAGTPTLLAVGLEPEQGKKLDRLKEGLEISYNQLMRYLERFGLTRVDPVQIQNLIAAATGPRRRLLIATAQRLAKIVRLYQKLMNSQQQLKAQIAACAREAQLEIRGHAFPGVVIRLGEHRQILTNGGPFCFHLVDGQIVDNR